MKFVDYQNAASLHIAQYLREAIEQIDEELGEGYARENPQLLAAFITACAADVHANILQDDIGAGIAELAAPIQAIADAITAHE